MAVPDPYTLPAPPPVGGDVEQLYSEDQASIDIISTLAHSYTRGVGFDATGQPNTEIRAVIIAAAARLAANPAQVKQTAGPFTTDGFQGWSIAELSVLNRYRVRAV